MTQVIKEESNAEQNPTEYMWHILAFHIVILITTPLEWYRVTLLPVYNNLTRTIMFWISHETVMNNCKKSRRCHCIAHQLFSFLFMKRTRKLDILNMTSAWQINTGCYSSFCNYDERGLIVMFYSKGIQAPREYILNFQKLLKDGNPFDFQWDMRHEERGVQMNSEWMSGVGRCGKYMWVGTILSLGIQQTFHSWSNCCF